MKYLFLAFFWLLFVNTPANSQQAFRMLQPAQMKGDLYLLRLAWTSLHPGIYRFNAPVQIDSLFKAAEECVAYPMDERRFFILLSQMAQQVHCGHTYLNPLNQPEATQKRLLPAKVIPLFFEVSGDKRVFITHNLSGVSGMKRGDEIIAINGLLVQRIIDSLLTVSRSDGMNSLSKKLYNIDETPDEGSAYSLFDIYLPLFFPSDSGYMVTVKSFSNKGNGPKNYPLAFLTMEQRTAEYERLFGTLPTGEKSWEYKLLNAHTAYMKFGTFAFWNSTFNETAYVDSVFHDLGQRKNIRNLVIDIRGNEGGDNTGKYILSYITSKKIGCDDPDRTCYRYMRVPDTLLRLLSTWDKSFKQPKDSTKFFRNELGLCELKADSQSCNFIRPQPGRFKGRVFLLINAKNSSAGYEMARDFKTAKLGTIIGATTGGCQQGINGGEFFFLTLPDSQIEIDQPLIYNYHPNKPDAGISPDYPVQNSQADIAGGVDRQLEAALKLAE